MQHDNLRARTLFTVRHIGLAGSLHLFDRVPGSLVLEGDQLVNGDLASIEIVQALLEV